MQGRAFLLALSAFSFLVTSSLATFGNYRCIQRAEDGTTSVVLSGDYPNPSVAPLFTPDADLSTLNDECSTVAIKRYMNNLSCYWHFQAPAGSFIYVVFGAFELDMECAKDNVKIDSTGMTADGGDPFRLRVCGHKKNWHYWHSIASSGVNVTLETDGEYSCRGITGFFHAFQPEVWDGTKSRIQPQPTECFQSDRLRPAPVARGPAGPKGPHDPANDLRLRFGRELGQSPRKRYLSRLLQRNKLPQANGRIDLPSVWDPQHVRCDPGRQGRWVHAQLQKSVEFHRLRKLLGQSNSCTIERELCNNSGCPSCRSLITKCATTTTGRDKPAPQRAQQGRQGRPGDSYRRTRSAEETYSQAGMGVASSPREDNHRTGKQARAKRGLSSNLRASGDRWSRRCPTQPPLMNPNFCLPLSAHQPYHPPIIPRHCHNPPGPRVGQKALPSPCDCRPH